MLVKITDAQTIISPKYKLKGMPFYNNNDENQFKEKFSEFLNTPLKTATFSLIIALLV